MRWRIHHKALTESTNLDARAGAPWDVFTADAQTAGRGRHNHAWHSAPGENLVCSAVVDVAGLDPAAVATFPLVAGLAVLRTARAVLAPDAPGLSVKWPNDVLAGGRKLAGVLCERQGDCVVAGVGVNVNQRVFPPDLAARATSLALLGRPDAPLAPARVLAVFLDELGALYGVWRERGFAALHPQLAACDWLRGRTVSVFQTDGDPAPLTGLCGGVAPDGTLTVAGTSVYAGEAHVARC